MRPSRRALVHVAERVPVALLPRLWAEEVSDRGARVVAGDADAGIPSDHESERLLRVRDHERAVPVGIAERRVPVLEAVGTSLLRGDPCLSRRSGALAPDDIAADLVLDLLELPRDNPLSLGGLFLDAAGGRLWLWRRCCGCRRRGGRCRPSLWRGRGRNQARNGHIICSEISRDE